MKKFNNKQLNDSIHGVQQDSDSAWEKREITIEITIKKLKNYF